MKKISIMLLAASIGFSTITFAELKLQYKPPQLGAPQTRIGSGTRGTQQTAGEQLWVLAPNHTALSGTAQPVLYWYLATTTSSLLEITVIRDGVEEPLLDKQLPATNLQGIQAIRLADYGVSLQEGVEYRWAVALITDSEQRSADLVSSATVRYQPPAHPLTSVEQLAESGYWYDAVAQLVDAKSPLLNQLLIQADLPGNSLPGK